MKTKNKTNHAIPKAYEPYKKIVICNNSFEGLNYIINDNGMFPILIGKGEFPRIWIYARNKDKPTILVRDSVAVFPQIRVNIFQSNKRLVVELFDMKRGYIKMLDITSLKEIPKVTQFDLRPLGYILYGEGSTIYLGKNTFTEDTFINVNTFVKIDTKDKGNSFVKIDTKNKGN